MSSLHIHLENRVLTCLPVTCLVGILTLFSHVNFQEGESNRFIILKLDKLFAIHVLFKHVWVIRLCNFNSFACNLYVAIYCLEEKKLFKTRQIGIQSNIYDLYDSIYNQTPMICKS